MRRALALALLTVALGLVALGFVLDPRAASFVLGGALLVAGLAVVDVDALFGRGVRRGERR